MLSYRQHDLCSHCGKSHQKFPGINEPSGYSTVFFLYQWLVIHLEFLQLNICPQHTTIRTMVSLNGKLLALVLALLLGVLPFAMPVTGMAAMASTDMSNRQISGASHSFVKSMVGDHAHKSCKGCSTAHGCTGSDCSCFQCGSCTAGIMHGPLNIHFYASSSHLPVSEISRLTHHPFQLFRPPRA